MKINFVYVATVFQVCVLCFFLFFFYKDKRVEIEVPFTLLKALTE